METNNTNTIDLSFLEDFYKDKNYTVLNREICFLFSLGKTEELKIILANKKFRKHINFNSEYYSINPLIQSCIGGHLDVIKLAIRDKTLLHPIDLFVFNNSAIIQACVNGHLDIVQYLLTSPDLKEHANINAQNNYAIKMANFHKNDHIVNYLILDYQMKIDSSLDEFIAANINIKKLIEKRDLLNKLKEIPNEKIKTSRLKL